MVLVVQNQGATYVFKSPKTDDLTSGIDTLTIAEKLRKENPVFYDFLDAMIDAGFEAQHYIVYDYSDGGVVREG